MGVVYEAEDLKLGRNVASAWPWLWAASREWCPRWH